MIAGFPKQTAPLTQQEMNLLPIFIKALSNHIGQNNAISNSDMISGLKTHGYKISQPRIRKLINYIRNNALIPKLCASDKGYYVASTDKELLEYLEGLHSRIMAQLQVYSSLKKQIPNNLPQIQFP